MNYPAGTKVFITCFLIAVFATVTYADELIYDNSNLTGYYFSPNETYTEFIDYGRSPGGRVCKFAFDYYTGGNPAGTIWVGFYRGTDHYDYGYKIQQFTLGAVPATGGYFERYEYVIPEDQQFDLPSGDFGYSFIFSRSTTHSAIASGGLGNEDWIWVYYYEPWNGFYISYIEGTWSGISMTVYAADPPDPNVCDISGYKFEDADGDGIWDAEENTLSGWNIFIDENTDGIYQDSEPNVLTDPNGFYIFEDLHAPATYTIREVEKDGWTQTLPTGPGYEYVINIEPNNVYEGYNFGNIHQELNAAVSGKKFHDLNGNSIFDYGEPGLFGWTVYADLNENGRYDTGDLHAVTNISGDYYLGGLSVGTYIIAEEMQWGWAQTYPTDACTYTVTIETPDQVIENIDFGNCTFDGYGGGSGTEEDPYLIDSHLHLQALGANRFDWDKHFKLTDDISLQKYEGEQFNLIGRYNFADEFIPFSGTFDGDGYYIIGLRYTYTDTPQEYIGLFGYVHGENAEIKNLTMYYTTVDTQGSGVDSGALVGLLESGTVSNCYVGRGSVKVDQFGAGGMIGYSKGVLINCHAKIDVESPSGSAGGLAARNRGGTITDCSAEGTVSGHMKVGGLVGSNGGLIERCYAITEATGFQYTGGLVGESYGDGVISECYSLGTIQTIDDEDTGLEGNEAGGMVGRQVDGAKILDSYSMADVSGGECIGGLVGLIWSTTGTCYITNCYAAGSVSGSHYLGGLVGTNFDGIVTDSVWDKETTGQYFSGGGTGKTTWQMQNEGTYEYLGWDLTTPKWSVCPAAGYPVLHWQQCQPYPGGVTQLWSAREGDYYIDRGEKVLVDQNGDIVAAGSIYLEHETETNPDILVIKYSPSGEKLWQFTYDSDPAGDSSDTAIDMAVDDSGNIYVTGTCYRDSRDILTVKIDTNGTLQWARFFDGSDNDTDEPAAMALDSLGNVYIAGEARTIIGWGDYCLLKYTPDGVLAWDRYYNGQNDESDAAFGICIDSNDNIYITGESEAYDYDYDIVTLKYNPAGDLLWDEIYQCPVDGYISLPNNSIGKPSDTIKADSNDNIYIAATIWEGLDENILLLKYDTDGTLLWPLIYDRAGYDDSEPEITLDESDNIYFACYSYDPNTDIDFLTVKLNSDGVELWSKVYNGADSTKDLAETLTVDARQNVYVAGVTNFIPIYQGWNDSLCTTLKYDADGTLMWSTDYKSIDNALEIPKSIAASENKVYVVGDFRGTWIDTDFRIICYGSCSYTGDTNTDLKVNLTDYAAFAAQWLESDCGECQKTDFTGDQSVLFDDVLKLAENWLNGVY